jgi:type IV pilus assembly protein PilC
MKNISLSSGEKISLISNLSTMLSAGIPILDAVNSLAEDARGHQQAVLLTLRDDLMQGKRIYTTLGRFPQAFDKVTVNIIKASEEAGTLDVSLKDLKDNIKKEMEFNDKVKSAAVYPLFITMVFFGVLLMMLVFVIPKISVVFTNLHMQLPLPTMILIFVSNLLMKNTLVFLGGLILAVGLLMLFYRKNKDLLFRLVFSLPIVSQLVKEIDLTRFTRSLYLLLSAGIPIATAMELAGEVVMKKNIAKVIAHSKDMIVGGKKLSEGFRSARGEMPMIVTKLIEAGEISGTLDKSMLEISEFMDYQVSSTLKTLTTLLEPLMLVVVGVCVGGMMLAIIAPIYGLIGSVSAR